MRHADVINRLIDVAPGRRYLEIGVNRGATFFDVIAHRKVAVDPHFLFDTHEAAISMPNAEFHEIKSDEFFCDVVDPDARFDVIFLDGLHTFEQTLRDFCNAVSYLAPGGIIVVDDVSPNTYAASLPDPNHTVAVRLGINAQDLDQSWMGDVYKLVFFIQTFFPQFNYGTVEDTMVMVVWQSRRKAADIVARSVSDIGQIGFDRTILDRSVYRVSSLDEIVNQFTSGTRGPSPTKESISLTLD
jgi:hypothetical protein